MGIDAFKTETDTDIIINLIDNDDGQRIQKLFKA